MKQVKLFFVLLSSFFILQQALFAQVNKSANSWTTGDPFKSNVFIENYGQFDKWVTSSTPIKYVINKGSKIFFTRQGLIIKLLKTEPLDEKEKKDRRRKASDEITSVIKSYTVAMTWEGCNANATIEASGQSEGYYTFGEKGYENIKAKGFKKILYKDLYPGIDVEYIIPDKGGIKYSLIVHPGADVAKVKMKYSGDIDKMNADNDGNIIIKTPAGNITDHAPASYIKETNDTIKSNFELSNNTISFAIGQHPTSNIQYPTSNIQYQLSNSSLQTLIIDPLMIVPTFLVNDYAAYDISYDDYSNIYVSGGTYPFSVAKYSPGGNFMWGFTYPLGWCPGAAAYGRFCLLPQSGTVFIGEAVNIGGPRVMKLRNNGTMLYTTPNFTGNEEIWVMFYNRCTGQLAGFGGGTSLPYNLQLIADTNLSGSTIKNFNNNTGPRNDIASVEMDYNGDFYALISSNASPSANHIMKSLVASGYNPPPAFDVYSGYNFFETANSGIPGFSPQNVTTRANALALNNDYLFSYDGHMLKAWNKSSGAQLGVVIVNTAYAGGQYRTHEGIAVDDCNRVYVGGSNLVHVYTFDGSTFTAAAPIFVNIPDEVYDVRLDKVSNTLYVAGLGFATVTPATVCNAGNVLNISHTIDNCFGNACVTATGGTLPYTYLWSTGATTNCVNNLQSGTYIVTVSDNSCIRQQSTDTIVIARDVVVNLIGDTVICEGSSTDLTAAGASNYIWSPSAGLSTSSGANVTASPLVTTTYIVTGTTNGCPGVDTITIHVNAMPDVSLVNDTLACGLPFVTLDAANPGFTYLWSTGATTQTIDADSTGTYWVIVRNVDCVDADTIHIHVVPNINLGMDQSLCFQPQDTLGGGIVAQSYLWSTGATSQQIIVSEPGNYWLTAFRDNCFLSDTIRVVGGFISMYVPNAFTPDDNGLNDIFLPKGEGINVFDMKIFTRWGEMIFETSDMNAGWDGTYKGKEAQLGVYVWVITYQTVCDENNVKRYGSVMLVR